MTTADSGIFLSRLGTTIGPPLTLKPGACIANRRFLVVKPLGRGGSGIVYQAHDYAMDRIVAVKTALRDGAAGQLLDHEAHVYYLLAGCQGVIQMYGLHEFTAPEGSALLLSLEYAPYGSFLDWIHTHDHPTRISKGIRHFKTICRIVSTLHHAGVLHLDIKPSNFLITPEGLKIADFGSSMVLSSGNVTCSHRSEPILRMATPEYGPPEFWDSARYHEIGKKSDCYSLGVLAYQLFHPECRLPFSGSEAELRAMHLHARPPRLVGVDDERIVNAVARCLKKT